MGKYLIVNADDFGLSEGVNRGIIEAAEHGIVTSVSLMVRWPAATSAAAFVRHADKISIGLHLDFGEWFYRDGQWVSLYTVVPIEDEKAVAAEVARQMTEFVLLVGRNPTHIDSHQHVHRGEPVRSIVIDLAKQLKVPLRDFSPSVRYCGDFYGQGLEGESLPGVISVGGLKTILAAVPDGITELGCHPGYDDGLKTAYRTERGLETNVLCDPASRQALVDLEVKLCSFHSLPQVGS